MHIEEFQQWLKKELDKRYRTYNELARRADLSSAYVSMVMTGQRNPGEKFCNGVAKAFDLPVDYVFRLAGILPEKPDLDHNTEIMLGLFRNLPADEQSRVLAIMRAFTTMHEIRNENDSTKGE